MDLEEGDVVLCTVDRIAGTTVFVKIEGNGEGSIIFSEIAPGRIRNIRSYVVPKKKIVCKVLRISKNQIELSYRRVTQDERKEILSKHKKEKSYENMLKSILGNEKAKSTISKIKEKDNLYDFFQTAKEQPNALDKIMGKKDSEKILKILLEEKPKTKKVKKTIKLKTKDENGLDLIKNVLGDFSSSIDIIYLSGGKYSLEKESENIKKADQLLQDILQKIEKFAKKHDMEFSISQK